MPTQTSASLCVHALRSGVGEKEREKGVEKGGENFVIHALRVRVLMCETVYSHSAIQRVASFQIM